MSIIPSKLTLTVYSTVWPDTETFLRNHLSSELEVMLDRHRNAHTKKQDDYHVEFFEAWNEFVKPVVFGLSDFTEMYPTAGSSEAIREIIRQASWKNQSLVIFDGEYEGYEAMASCQNTEVIRVNRDNWKETLESWRKNGTPWGNGGAQWWISQPSAIDGDQWLEFTEWLCEMQEWPECNILVDLCYVGSAEIQGVIDVGNAPSVSGVVFSLSKIMGCYYRRIGGCLSKTQIPGLWGNHWFKNIDSLHIGTKWLEGVGDAVSHGKKYKEIQKEAMERAVQLLGGEALWKEGGISWKACDVPLLMKADNMNGTPPKGWEEFWKISSRGKLDKKSVRICLTPIIEEIFEERKNVA